MHSARTPLCRPLSLPSRFPCRGSKAARSLHERREPKAPALAVSRGSSESGSESLPVLPSVHKERSMKGPDSPTCVLYLFAKSV